MEEETGEGGKGIKVKTVLCAFQTFQCQPITILVENFKIVNY